MTLTKSRNGHYYYPHGGAPVERTRAPSPEMLAEAALLVQLAMRTQDRYLEDADAALAGWREKQDASLHYRFKENAAA